MRFQSEKKRNESLLDITPVVDTVFNLLIFFAVTLNFVSTGGIKVNLPQSSTQEIVKEPKFLQVSLKSSGQIYLGDSPMDLTTLAERFTAAAALSGDTQVLIQADQDVSHGKVVAVMDLARKSRLHRLAIVTRPAEGQWRNK